MDYREYPPPADLARHVQCVWRLVDPNPDGGIQTIYPDGRCELIVHLGVAPRCWDAVKGWHQQAPHLFAAQRITAVRLSSRGPLDCIGVRLKPAASSVLGASVLTQARDRVADLACIDAAFAEALTAAVRRFAVSRRTSLWRLLSARFSVCPIDPRVEGAACRIESSGGNARIAVVARAAALSIRGLQTKFRRAVGLTPKEFARLVRLQSTIRAIDSDARDLAAISMETGFADQSHATREMQRVTGLTPARLRAELRCDRHGDAAIRLAAAFVRGHAA